MHSNFIMCLKIGLLWRCTLDYCCIHILHMYRPNFPIINVRHFARFFPIMRIDKQYELKQGNRIAIHLLRKHTCSLVQLVSSTCKWFLYRATQEAFSSFGNLINTHRPMYLSVANIFAYIWYISWVCWNPFIFWNLVCWLYPHMIIHLYKYIFGWNNC